MARKYLQMGYTRARRYANHKSSNKYDTARGEEILRTAEDYIKAESSRIFYDKWKEAEKNLTYKNLNGKQKMGRKLHYSKSEKTIK